jgi:hypothetical protein
MQDRRNINDIQKMNDSSEIIAGGITPAYCNIEYKQITGIIKTYKLRHVYFGQKNAPMDDNPTGRNLILTKLIQNLAVTNSKKTRQEHYNIMAHRENKKKTVGTNPLFCGEDTKRIATAFNSTSGIPQNIPVGLNSCELLTDKNNGTPLKDWLNDSPPQDHNHSSPQEQDYILDDFYTSNAEYLEFSDSTDLTPPSDFLLDQPILETKGTEQKKRAAKKEPEYRLQQLINIAIKEKCKHLGVEHLSEIQTDIVEKTEQINYKSRSRGWGGRKEAAKTI